MPVRKTLANIPRDRPVSVMVRHAARDPIRSADEGWNARLTAVGHEAARELGADLAEIAGSRPIQMFSSPIPRCQQTAERVREGLTSKAVATRSPTVVDALAGPYLHDANAVMAIALRLGDQTFVRQWFDGKLDHTVLLPATDAARGQLEVLASALDGAHDDHRNTLHLHFSHDWNILLIREHFVGITHEDAEMPGFMDGVAVWRQGEELAVAYRAHVKLISLEPGSDPMAGANGRTTQP